MILLQIDIRVREFDSITNVDSGCFEQRVSRSNHSLLSLSLSLEFHIFLSSNVCPVIGNVIYPTVLLLEMFPFSFYCFARRTKNSKIKVNGRNKNEKERKKEVLFSFRRSADNDDLRDGHRHAGEYYHDSLSFSRVFFFCSGRLINRLEYIERTQRTNEENSVSARDAYRFLRRVLRRRSVGICDK